MLFVLLALPVYAVSRLKGEIDWRFLIGASLAISIFTYFAYRSDKRRAEGGAWRIPESTLHVAELAGGWPGGFLAQRWLCHKTAKTSYQLVFWIIVLAYQLIALDSLLGWRLTNGIMRSIKSAAV